MDAGDDRDSAAAPSRDRDGARRGWWSGSIRRRAPRAMPAGSSSAGWRGRDRLCARRSQRRRAAPGGLGAAGRAAAEAWGADRVVAETNQGGEMVESVLRGVDAGAAGQAGPCAAAARARGPSRSRPCSRAGEAQFAGRFPALEDELAGLTSAGGYEGPGRSPDRADAMVWAMTELMLRAPPSRGCAGCDAGRAPPGNAGGRRPLHRSSSGPPPLQMQGRTGWTFGVI